MTGRWRWAGCAPPTASWTPSAPGPSGTLFRAGERLRLVVSGTDIHAPLHKHEDSRNDAVHAIRTGGRYDSHLLIPVVAGG